MVTWRHISPLYKPWYRLITVEPRLRSLKRGLVISRFLSIHYTVTGAENIVRYTEVPLYEREREIGLTPLPRFWLLSQFAHSHPFESRIIPTPLPRQFSLEEVLDCSTCTWQFNSYSTIISGDRTKWLSINSLVFWKIDRVIVQRGRGGGAFAHHQISRSSFDSQSSIFP